MANELVITRIFDASREIVWKVWTQPELVAKWLAPADMTARVDELSPTPGGHMRYVMFDASGKEYPGESIYSEVIEKEKLVSADEFGEAMENDPNFDLPHGVITTATFEDTDDGKTKVTLTISHPTPEDKKKHENMGVIEGWNSSLDKFAEVLKTI